MMCEEVMDLMQRHLDRDLDAAEEEAMQEHIAKCPECAAMWERLNRLDQELDALPKVTPPFSLVDAIMPQLDAIDPYASDSTAAAAAPLEAPAAATPARRFVWRRMPWATVGGVVAAGIVLGLFMINSDIPRSNVANDTLSAGQRESGAAAGSSAAPRMMSTAADSADKTSGGAADQESAKMKSANEAPAGEANGNAAEQNVTSAEPTVPRMAPTPAEEPVRGETAASGLQPPAAAPREGAAAGGGEAAGQAASGPPIAMEALPAAPNAPPAGDSYSEAAVPGPQAEDRGKAGFAPEQDGFGVLGFEPAPASELASPDGKLLAAVENQRVVIRKGQDTVFTSAQQWPADASLQLERWEDDSKLVYAVVQGEARRTMIVDVTAKSETAADPAR